MGKIYIIGLGPGSVDHLTLGAIERIHSGHKNFLRTEKHPTVSYFLKNNIDFESFDYLYDKEEDFEGLYNNIADSLIKEARERKVINYFVPGNPLVAEKTVEILLQKDIETEIISGMSFIEPMVEIVGRDPINGLKIVDGSDFDSLMIDINVDTIITQVYNRRIMSDIKLILAEIYGDEYNIWVINGAGIEEEEKVHNIPIYNLDRIDKIGYLTSVYIPSVNNEREGIYDFNNIVKILRILRGENGCPWDIKQDHKSIRNCVIEEAYEVVDAIDSGDIDNFIEELGDLLLQVIFHGEIANDEGEFNLIDITSKLAEKLIYRHPHIFLVKEVENTQEVGYNWNELKDSQRGLSSVVEKMTSLPALPALMKSYKIQDRAAQVGFDWDDIRGPLDKIMEEYEEVLESIETKDKDKIEEELGDLLFAVVNLARFLKVDPEVALNGTNNKFIKRFAIMEKEATKAGKKLEHMSLSQMDLLWDKAKEDKS